KSDFLFAEFLKDFGIGKRLRTLVVDVTNQRCLFDGKNNDNSTAIPRLLVDSNILEVSEGVQGPNVACDDIRIQFATRLCLQVIFDRLPGNAAIAVYRNTLHCGSAGGSQRLRRGSGEEKNEQT